MARQTGRWMIGATLLASVLLAGPMQSQAASAEPPEPTTFLLTLGLNAEGDARWDGAIEVDNGAVVLLEGRDFLPTDPFTKQSTGNEITGPNSWRASVRRDQLPEFLRINYLEMSPSHEPKVFFYPTSLFVGVQAPSDARVAVKTVQGDFEFALSELGDQPLAFLDGRATVAWTPAVERLSGEEYEDDEAAIAAAPGGEIAAGWVAYRERADRVFVRVQNNGVWSEAEEATPKPGDIFRCSLAYEAGGALWVFWSERDGAVWHLWGRRKADGPWEAPVRISAGGSNTFHRAASSGDGTIYVVWQSFRDGPGRPQSDIYMRALEGGKWSDEIRLSDSPANDWEPAVAAGDGGTAFFAWDGYDKGDYDIFFRDYRNGALGAIQAVTSSPRFQAHASLAVDPQNRPWLAWDESGANWGKDQGFLINPPTAVPLHQERSLRVAMLDGGRWVEPKETLAEFYPYRLFPNMENPQIIFDGAGALTMVFRHWTRRTTLYIGSPIGWENFLTRFDGKAWTEPAPLAHSRGSIEKRPALARGAEGDIQAAWMTDNRTFEIMRPQNAEIYTASLGLSGSTPSFAADTFQPLAEPFVEDIPVHSLEAEDVKTVRAYTIDAGGRAYKIYRGDLHRHTDVSQDFKYDGSLIEVYRYGMDAAAMDFIVPTDHQSGWDMEFTWWQDQKLTDLFNVAGAFTPLFGYERSLTFPNGHRNVIFAHRGVRTLPIPAEEKRGETGAQKLFDYLHENDGISMPHSSGTDQGTDFRDNDPEVEPVMEVFQGYRTSYEYVGAPKAASDRKLLAQRSGYNPLGYWWKALAKGLKLGVQASSDHWSTHISYACLLSESFTREGLFEAIKSRHCYGATDNIVLDFQARSGGRTYIMGDILEARQAPALSIRAIGTDRIKQLAIVKNQSFVYVGRPNAKSVELEFTDQNFEPGPNYYYVRVLQNDGQLAWSSPIWVEPGP